MKNNKGLNDELKMEADGDTGETPKFLPWVTG